MQYQSHSTCLRLVQSVTSYAQHCSLQFTLLFSQSVPICSCLNCLTLAELTLLSVKHSGTLNDGTKGGKTTARKEEVLQPAFKSKHAGLMKRPRGSKGMGSDQDKKNNNNMQGM